jgi:arginine N-succinyltransferase
MAEPDMTEWMVRMAAPSDLDSLEALAQLAGGGFTNLPANREALARRLDWARESLAKAADAPGDDLYLLMLEHRPTGRVVGTAAVFSQVGKRWPFYSYKVTTLSLHSRELGRTFRTRVLHLVNDFDGASEVGGLFLHPDCRTGGLGRLLARSRYLFIARHRARFADRLLAELRGVIGEDGSSPFWDGLAGRFFGMGFSEADAFNGANGNQFIADLMPKFPVYEALLPESAVAVIGCEHPAGRAARRMLEAEGFRHNDYVDIFDGGPTLDIETDRVRSIRKAEVARVADGPVPPDTPLRLAATGRLALFRAMALPVHCPGEAVAHLHPAAGIAPGEEIHHAPF